MRLEPTHAVYPDHVFERPIGAPRGSRQAFIQAVRRAHADMATVQMDADYDFSAEQMARVKRIVDGLTKLKASLLDG